MRKLVLLFVLAVLFSCKPEKEESNVLRHVIMFKWNESTSPEKMQELSALFASLPSKIEVIKDFEWGADVSVEGLTKGYTHCYIMSFADEEGRNTYLPHPEHKAFGDALGPYLEDVIVLDFLSSN